MRPKPGGFEDPDALPSLADSGGIAEFDFEDGKPGNSCVGWQGVSANTSIAVGIAQHGNKSCRVCMTNPGGYAAPQVPISMGRTYTAELWMATLSDAGAAGGPDGGQASSSLRFLTDAGYFIKQVDNNARFVPGEWVEVQVTAIAPAGAEMMPLLTQISPSGVNDCFYVDNVNIYVQ